MRDINFACIGKTGYLSWDKASRALSRGRFIDKHGRGEMKVYRCRLCAHWHIGRSSMPTALAR